MIFERPLLLAALVSLPILWFLARVRRTRRAVPVSSLLIWSRLDLAPEPPRETARRADRLLLLRLLAAALISVGLAGPRLAPTEGQASLHVLLDESASMRPFASRAEEALDAVRTHAPAGALIREHRADGTSLLPSLLASTDGDLVVITDHAPAGLEDPGRVRLLLVGEPLENVGIVSVWFSGEERFGALVESFASAARRVTLTHPGGSVPLALEPGGVAKVEGPAPGGRVELRLRPGDRFPHDDAVTAVRVPARALELRWSGPDEPRTRLALEVAGVRFTQDAERALTYRSGASRETAILLAPPGEKLRIRPGTVTGGPDLAPEAVPGAATPLGASVRFADEGALLLSDAEGVLARAFPEFVDVAPDPGDPSSRWAADPSFPIFWAEVARLLGARPPGVRIEAGFVGREESATRAEGGPFHLDGLAAGEPEGREEGTGLSGWLFLLGAGLLGALLLTEGRRRASQRSPVRFPDIGA